MAQITNGFNTITSDEQEGSQEHWHQPFEFVKVDGCGIKNMDEDARSDMIKVEIKDEELDIPCECIEQCLHKCHKTTDNVDALYYNPLVDVMEPVSDLKNEFHEEASQDLSMMKSPEQSSVANSSSSQTDGKEESEVGPHPCSVCGKGFSRLSSLRKHLLLHNIRNSSKSEYTETTTKSCGTKPTRRYTREKQRTCPTCHKVLAVTDNLQAHMRTHTQGTLFSCTKCNYKCSQSSNLLLHMRTHTGEKPFACSECDYKSAWYTSLKIHMRTHTGEKPFLCTECNYKCAQSTDLKMHMRTHTGERPFFCTECDYKASQSASLNAHMRTHNGQKPFSCTKCNYKCTQSHTLQVHMRSHTGEKPFSCTECDYKCTRSDHLKLHMCTHTGEKPFACPNCNYKCSRSSYLKVHMLTHTRGRTA